MLKNFTLRLAFNCLLLTTSLSTLTSPIATATPLETIQKRGTLIIGIKDNLRPLGYRDPNGNLIGFEIDLAHQLAQTLLGDRQAIQLIPLDNRDRLNALLTGQIDLTIAHLTPTADRRRIVQFSPAYHFSGTALITEQPDLTQRSAWQDRRLGVIENSSSIAILRSHLPRPQLIPYPSYQAALTGIRQNEIVGFAGDSTVLAGWLQEHPNFQRSGPLLSAEPLAIAFPKGQQHETLRQALQTTISQWQQSGYLNDLAQTWQLMN